MSSTVERLAAVRSDVEQVCGWLLSPSPDVLDRCSPVLSAAAASLTDSVSWMSLARGDPEALAEAWRLRRITRRAGALLRHAADYHAQWRGLDAAANAGYRSGGEPAAAAPPGKISVLG